MYLSFIPKKERERKEENERDGRKGRKGVREEGEKETDKLTFRP